MKTMRQILWMVAGVAGVALLAAAPAPADIVHNDDVIITFSLCVGNDCVNGESFGFDTIRLKENNTRIKFDDTSSTASFPRNDWQLTANDSSNGGAEKFSIDDIGNGRTPFTIEASAPSHSLFVDDAGRLGLKTSTPVVELHIKDGDTPTLRLEQDGSSGFTPQTWDVAGNETNFFVRDVTNGSRLPFKIFPGADTNSLTVGSDEQIGMGTQSPTQPLHVRRSDGTAQILVEEVSGTAATRRMLELENNGGVGLRLTDNESTVNWFVTNRRTNSDLVISDTASGTDFILEQNGDLAIEGALTTTGATCNVTPCDGVFLPDFELETIEEHAAYMWSNSHLEAVGATLPDEPFNMTAKTTGMLNELEKAHIYIEQLHQRLKEIEARLASAEDVD